jgi:hypothetical protein
MILVPEHHIRMCGHPPLSEVRLWLGARRAHPAAALALAGRGQ